MVNSSWRESLAGTWKGIQRSKEYSESVISNVCKACELSYLKVNKERGPTYDITLDTVDGWVH